jgi:hypothetical protein
MASSLSAAAARRWRRTVRDLESCFVPSPHGGYPWQDAAAICVGSALSGERQRGVKACRPSRSPPRSELNLLGTIELRGGATGRWIGQVRCAAAKTPVGTGVIFSRPPPRPAWWPPPPRPHRPLSGLRAAQRTKNRLALGGRLSSVSGRTACRGTCSRCGRRRRRGARMIRLVRRMNASGAAGGDF